tara:strand:- start:1416 stop:2168 length:753 start_codon:yes stop_codon:yes gene_type:complete
MNYKLLLFLFLLISGCNQYSDNKKINLITEKKYKNSGFALVNDSKNKKEKKVKNKLDNRSLLIFHKNLTTGSLVKITNPTNQKSIIAKVKSNKIEFSDFYNSVITVRIAEELKLDLSEPYVDLVLISGTSSFIAKKAKTFDEEKNVAQKAPVDGITIDILGSSENLSQKVENSSFLYSIKIADFYYKNSAENMVKRIINETNLKKALIRKMTNTKYRVLLGPFSDIKKLKRSYDEIKSLNFENIEILKNV